MSSIFFWKFDKNLKEIIYFWHQIPNMSDTTDSQGSIVFVTEKKVVLAEVHPSPHPVPETSNATPETVHVPETQENSHIPQNNTTANHPEDDDDCIMVIPETTGKYQVHIFNT